MTRPLCDRSHYDAVVIGARCAGASTAMLLARAGAKVLMVDRQAYGSDTVSTHALMRAGVLQLERWGLLSQLMAAGTPAVRRTTFHYGDETIPIDIKPEHGVAHLCAPRRNVLDRILVDAARKAGVEVRHGVSMTDLQFGSGGRIVGAILKDQADVEVAVGAGIVVGADGRQSAVAKRVGARTCVEGVHASAYVYGYFAGLPDDGYHWYFGRDVAAGVIPTNDNHHCVFASVPRKSFGSEFRKDLQAAFARTVVANSPRLGEDIAKAGPITKLHSIICSPGFLRQAHGAGWALVGDAGYFKDPLTAHGITDALRDAELLSRAICAGHSPALARYQEERDALSWPLFEVTDAIASFDWDVDRIKDHHGRLSKAMKAEAEHVVRHEMPVRLAA